MLGVLKTENKITYEVYSNGWDEWFGKCIVGETEEERTLAHATVANE